MQLPGRASQDGSRTSSETEKADKKRKHEELMSAQKAAKAAKVISGGKGGGKGSKPVPQPSGKGAKRERGINVPQALIGKQTLTSAGKRMCFAYNLGNCTEVPDGGECSKGLHLCMELGCQMPHPCKNHR